MADVLDDEALLNIDDVRDATSSDLDDDQIAVLLARDTSDREENVELSNGDGSNNTNAVKEPIAQEGLLRPDGDDEGFDEAPEAAAEDIEDVVEDVQEIAESSEGSTSSSNADEHVEDVPDTEKQVEQNGGSNEIVDVSDDDVVEDNDESEEVEEDSSGQGSSTRKRAGSSSSPKAPAPKRNRPERPFFESRQKVIDAVSGIYGSWDASLNVSQIHVLADLRKKHYEEIIARNVKSENDLRSEVQKLREERKNEEKLKQITQRNLNELTKNSNSMREEVESLSRLVTQPPVTEQRLGEESPVSSTGPPPPPPPPQYVQPRLQRYPSNMSSVSQQNTPRHHQAQQQAPPRFYPKPLPTTMDPVARQQLEQQRAMDRNALMLQYAQANGTPRGNVMVRGAPLQMNQRTPTQMPPQRTRVEIGVPPANNNTQSPQQPKFPTIQRLNYSMGHTLPILQTTNSQSLKDVTKDNCISLCVPLVPLGLVISCGDSARLPSLPRMLSSLEKSPDLSVTILSSADDFKDNWQIGGKINYEMLGNLEHKNIQIYVQVASLKAAGLHGSPSIFDVKGPLNWGISKEWPCKTKSHKFRLQFHQQQVLPQNDRITIVVVAKDEITGKLEISETVYLNLL